MRAPCATCVKIALLAGSTPIFMSTPEAYSLESRKEAYLFPAPSRSVKAMPPTPDEELASELRALTSPSGRDLLEAREVILGLLEPGGTQHERDLLAEVLQRRSVPADANGQTLEVARVGEEWTALTGDEAPLAYLRLSTAIRESLARLAREGLVTPAEGTMSGGGSQSVQVRRVYGSSATTGGVSFDSQLAEFDSDGGKNRWRLAEPSGSPRLLLARESLPDGLDDLLGIRGIEVLKESVRCFHRGLFIAAVDLLAAASEAAWFGVARAAGGVDIKLDAAVAKGEPIAEVIQRTTDALAGKKVLSGPGRNDLRAQAARYRDLRNYGLHPVGDPDADRELAFSEVGAAALFMTARRYFALLEEARVGIATALTPTP